MARPEGGGFLPPGLSWGRAAAAARLWSGLALFAFAATHFINHAFGHWSIDAMTVVQDWRTAVTRSLPGTAVLLASAAVHPLLGLFRFLQRRTMTAIEWLQLASGMLIPVLLTRHLIGTRIAARSTASTTTTPGAFRHLARLGAEPVAVASPRVAARLHRHPPLAHGQAALRSLALAAGRPRRPRSGARPDRFHGRQPDPGTAAVHPAAPRARAGRAPGSHRDLVDHRLSAAPGGGSGAAAPADLARPLRPQDHRRLCRRAARCRAARPHPSGDQPAQRHPARLRLRRPRPLLDLPGPCSRRPRRSAGRARAGSARAGARGRSGQCATGMSAAPAVSPSRRSAAAGRHRRRRRIGQVSVGRRARSGHRLLAICAASRAWRKAACPSMSCSSSIST